MISRLYVDNFRTLVNFEIELGALTLVLGPNGGGKTTLLEVLRCIRDFCTGKCDLSEAAPGEVFSASTRTAWQDVAVQTFDLTLARESDEFVYHLEIQHDRDRPRRRIQREQLHLNSKPLYESQLEDDEELRARLFRDNHSEGPPLLVDWSRSGIASIQPRHDNKHLTWFRERMQQIITTSLDPFRMLARAEKESQVLAWHADNFVGWFRWMTSLDLGLMGQLGPVIENALTAYSGAWLEPDGGDAKRLRIKFMPSDPSSGTGRAWSCSFDELSHGQRAIFVLYTLLKAVRDGWILCVDEPENFLALPEIQPWLNELIDHCEESPSAQALLVSHHPELINALAVGRGKWLDRPSGFATRVKPITEQAGGLAISELITRGWLHA